MHCCTASTHGVKLNDPFLVSLSEKVRLKGRGAETAHFRGWINSGAIYHINKMIMIKLCGVQG